MRSSGILRSKEWEFHTDVSGHHIGPAPKSQAVKYVALEIKVWQV